MTALKFSTLKHPHLSVGSLDVKMTMWIKVILTGLCFCSYSCTESYPKCLNSSGLMTKRYFYVGDQTLDIRLEISDRLSHQLITHILRIILQDAIGYVNVSMVKKIDYMNATAILNRISGCSERNCEEHKDDTVIPETMINLEVWMGPGYNTQLWVNSKRLELCGPLGPLGRFAWFIPQYLAEKGIPGRDIIDHWRALQQDDVAKVLDLSDDFESVKSLTRNDDTNEYYCNFSGCSDGIYYPQWCIGTNASCATLLAKYPAISNGMIRELIHNLKLKVKVAFLGPQFENYIIRRTRDGKPVLFFSWKPNYLTSLRNYTNIAFPRCEDIHQIGLPFPSNCAFEINQVNKVAWTGLTLSGAEAMHLVKGVRFTQKEYQQLLDSFVKNYTWHSLADVACSWVQNNRNIWETWIPKNFTHKLPIYIGGIFPKSGTTYVSKGIIPAVRMAVEAINHNETILKDYQLFLLEEDGACSSDHVMKSFIKYVHSKEFPRIIGILGPACSDTVEPLAGVAKHYNAIIISYSAEGAIFYNNKDYPYFFRTIPSNKQFKCVYKSLFKIMGWQRVATLTAEGMKYPEYLSLTQDYLQAHGVNFIVNRKFPKDRTSNMTQYLEDLKQKNARIIIGDFYDAAGREVMCEAYRQGMTAYQGYVWFLPRWFSKNWYDVDFYNSQEANPSARVPCSTREMIAAINGYMSLAYSYFNDDHAIMQENITVEEWRRKYKEKMIRDKVGESDDYAGYSYDATWVFALGMDKLLKLNHSYISTLHTEKTAKKYVEILNKTDFVGVSGHMHFVGPSRISVIYINQWVNKKLIQVGRYMPTPGSDVFILNESSFTWFTHNHKKPGDGREEISQCALEALSTLLDVDCEVAIVIVNIVGFGLFALLMLTLFIFIKHRYDKKVRVTEERMKELGLMNAANNTITLDQWEISRDCVVINRKIGEGAFGKVYGGEVHFDDKGWVPVAIKTLKIGSTIEEKLDFLSEAEMMKRFDHQNIVSLLGVCTRGEPVYTIMEFLLYGDLKTYLLARRHMVNEKSIEDSGEMSDKQLTSMALDIGRGLSYLAEMKYVHRDLACRNCLVNANRVVKIGDFGMTRPMYDSDYYRFNKKGMLPVRWMAPESLADGLFTPMSDVWSYGVLLFEIITFGSFPFQGLSNNQVLEHVKKGNRLSVPDGCSSQLKQLLESFWVKDPQLRPPASLVVEILANNPRLIKPCLDMPMASVEIEGTDSLEIQMLDKGRKFSLNQNKHAAGSRKRSNTIDTTESIPLCYVKAANERFFRGFMVENGLYNKTNKVDHLTGLKRPMNGATSSRAKYITLQQKDKGLLEEPCDFMPKDGLSKMTHL